jgi:CheY-like chemotaxis protein
MFERDGFDRDAWPRKCSCGRAWLRAPWCELVYVGTFEVEGSTLELRQCLCGSTISVERDADIADAESFQEKHDRHLGDDTEPTKRVRRYSIPPRTPHLLVVDDDPLVRLALERGLSSTWSTSHAANGEQMLSAVANGASYDAILLDVELPGLGGRVAFEKLRELNPRLESRVVFMTGGPATDASRRFLASIQNPWLRKPFSPPLLRDLLDIVHRDSSRAS